MFPPCTPLTLQLTAVSDVFATVAVKAAWAPSKTDPLAGVTVTAMDGGGGGGGGGAPDEPQPSVQAPSARSAANRIALVVNRFLLRCERDRMPSQKQAKGQRKGQEQKLGSGESQTASSAKKVPFISSLANSKSQVLYYCHALNLALTRHSDSASF